MSDSLLIKLVTGSGYDSGEIIFTDETDAPVDLDGANIRFVVKKIIGGETILEWSSATGKVPISLPTTLGTARLLLNAADVAAFDTEFADYVWLVDFGSSIEFIDRGKVWKV